MAPCCRVNPPSTCCGCGPRLRPRVPPQPGKHRADPGSSAGALRREPQTLRLFQASMSLLEQDAFSTALVHGFLRAVITHLLDCIVVTEDIQTFGKGFSIFCVKNFWYLTVGVPASLIHVSHAPSGEELQMSSQEIPGIPGEGTNKPLCYKETDILNFVWSAFHGTFHLHGAKMLMKSSVV